MKGSVLIHPAFCIFISTEPQTARRGDAECDPRVLSEGGRAPVEGDVPVSAGSEGPVQCPHTESSRQRAQPGPAAWHQM